MTTCIIKQKLFKKDNTGAIRIWWPEIFGKKYRFHSGQLDGKIITTGWTIAEGMNIGRSNETTPEEQALLEVQSHIEKKLKRGYTTDVNKIDEKKATLIAPMLAHDYQDYQHKLTFPLFSQPKLDGIRCIAKHDGLWTRKGERISTVKHIEEKIIGLVRKYDMIFDGELYNHELKNDFNKIASIVRRQKIDPEHAEIVKTIQYHIYDIVDENKTFSQRNNLLEKILEEDKHIKLVDTYKHRDHENLNVAYEGFIEDGYEGQMVRLDDIYYRKRTHVLLKRKEFIDEEFIIIDIIEGKGNRSGQAGAMKLALSKGKFFQAAIMGTDDFRKRVLKKKDQIIGREATVKYFHKTPDGVPRFPVVKSIENFVL